MFTYDDVMNAINVTEAVYRAENAMSGHEDQARAMLRTHWGVVLCSCCLAGHHDVK